MQREILFKAKRKDVGLWQEGQIVQVDGKYFITDTECTKIEKSMMFISGEMIYDLKYMYEVFPNTICEYTGLKDKNNVKIFENDILQGFEEYYDEFVKGMVDLDLYNGMQLVIKENSCHFDYIYDYEVIGNIFDEEVE